MAVVSWSSPADWDRFSAPEIVNTIVGGQELTLGATADEGTVDGGALGDGNDRRIYRYFGGEGATDLEARLDFRLILGGNPTPQIGLVFFREAGLPLVVWTNIVFEANARLLLGAWEYDGTTLISINQQTWLHDLRDGGVPQIFGDPDRIRVLRVRVDEVGTRLRIKQWIRDEDEPEWQYDGPMPAVVGAGPGEVGLLLAHLGAGRGDINIDTLSIAVQGNGYATRTEVKRWLSIDEPTEPHTLDELIDAAIDGVSRWVDARCRRHFFQAVETRRFAATSAHELVLGHFNDLVSVTALRTDEDGDGVYETTWASAAFTLQPVRSTAAPEPKPYRAVQAIGRTFPRANALGQRCERIEIEGVWGWPAIPDPVNTATKIQVARIVKRKEAPEGIVGLSQFGAIRVSGKPDPDVSAALGGYRLRAVG